MVIVAVKSVPNSRDSYFNSFSLAGANISSNVILSAGTAGKQWKAILNYSAF